MWRHPPCVCVLLCLGPGASDLHNTYLAINENLTDDEVDELIRLCDHDGDGQVRLGNYALLQHCHLRSRRTRTRECARALACAHTHRWRRRGGDEPERRMAVVRQVSYEEFRKMVLDFNKKAAGR